MAPKKCNIKVSTGAGTGISTKKLSRIDTHQLKTTAESLKEVSVTVKPQSNLPKSGPMQTHLDKRASTPSSPSLIAITKACLCKRLSTKTASSPSTPAEPYDSEFDKQNILKAATKAAAFHNARGLSFEELHVLSDCQADSTNLSTSNKISQKNSNSAMRILTKTSNGEKAGTSSNSVSKKRTMTDDDEFNTESPPVERANSTEVKTTTNKDISNDNNESTSSPIKRLKINPPRPPTKRAADTSDGQPASKPVKRLKIKPPRAVAMNPAAPAARNHKSNSKSKGGPVITKNGKIKKTPEYAVEHAFEGTPSNHGSSIERPQFGSLHKPWSCANLACSTGMTWVPRDTKDAATGRGPMGRKVISQYFGRNKGPTKIIPNDVWHFYCRKDYQRARYAAEHGTTDELAKQVINNLRDQLIRLKLWRPNALFQMQLDKSATDRLNCYFGLLRQHSNDEAAALAAIPAPRDPKKVKPEEAFPLALAEVFNQRFKTPGTDATATYNDVEAVIAWSEAEINAGNSTVFVPAEFLINPVQAGETVNNVSNNFAEWESTRVINAPEVNNCPFPSASMTSNCPLQNCDVTQSIEDPVQSESEHRAPTLTPAPCHRHIQGNPNDPMLILRQLNDAAAFQSYQACSDRSSS